MSFQLGVIADQIGLKIMREAAAAGGGSPVHELAGFGEPRRPHNHRLTALPVDFAFLDVLVFEMVEQAPCEQRDEHGRETVRLFVFKAIIAGDIAFRSRKEDHAKNSATHGLSSPLKWGRSWLRQGLARFRLRPLRF
jgi:hypothetical protein